MYFVLAIMLAASPQARLDRSIEEWCSANHEKVAAACVAKQTEGLKRFLAVSVELYDPKRTSADACLRRSAVPPSLDWSAAGRCLNEVRRDRLADWRSPDKDLRPTPLPDIRFVPFVPGVH